MKSRVGGCALALCCGVWLAVSGCSGPKDDMTVCWFTCPSSSTTPGACRSQADCDHGQLCAQGVCRSPCDADDDCSIGAYCERSGVLVGPAACLPGCRSHQDRTGPEWCNLETHACQSGCYAAGQCFAGYGCGDAFNSTRTCLPTCGSDDDCVTGDACYDGALGERYCGPAGCRDSAQCHGPGEWCGSLGDERHCRSDCVDSQQCPNGFVCSPLLGQVGPPFTCQSEAEPCAPATADPDADASVEPECAAQP
jgi:hypothetical protein